MYGKRSSRIFFLLTQLSFLVLNPLKSQVALNMASRIRTIMADYATSRGGNPFFPHDSISHEIRRKSFHLLPALLAPAIVYGWLLFFSIHTARIVAVSILGFFVFLFILHEIGLKKGFSHRVIIAHQVFSAMQRKEEVENKTFVGSYLYFGTVLVLFIFLDPVVAVFAFGLSAIGDGAASIIGKLWGRISHPFNQRKTIEGSLAFIVFGFLYSFLFLLVFQHHTSIISIEELLVFAILLSIAGALAEGIPGQWYWDQLTVPLTIGVVGSQLLI